MSCKGSIGEIGRTSKQTEWFVPCAEKDDKKRSKSADRKRGPSHVCGPDCLCSLALVTVPQKKTSPEKSSNVRTYEKAWQCSRGCGFVSEDFNSVVLHERQAHEWTKVQSQVHSAREEARQASVSQIDFLFDHMLHLPFFKEASSSSPVNQ